MANGSDALSRYQASLSGPQGTRASSRSVVGTDAFGNPLRGTYESGSAVEARAQDRLFAQLTGATAQQLLGPTLPGKRPNLTYLRPEQLEALQRMRSRVGGSDAVTPSMAASFSLPGGSAPQGAPDPTGMGLPAGLDPKRLALIGVAVLVGLFVLRSLK